MEIFEEKLFGSFLHRKLLKSSTVEEIEIPQNIFNNSFKETDSKIMHSLGNGNTTNNLDLKSLYTKRDNKLRI